MLIILGRDLCQGARPWVPGRECLGSGAPEGAAPLPQCPRPPSPPRPHMPLGWSCPAGALQGAGLVVFPEAQRWVGAECSHLVQLRRTWTEAERLRGRVVRRDGPGCQSPEAVGGGRGPSQQHLPCRYRWLQAAGWHACQGQGRAPHFSGTGHQEVQASGPPSVLPAGACPTAAPRWPWRWAAPPGALGPVPASVLSCEPSLSRAVPASSGFPRSLLRPAASRARGWGTSWGVQSPVFSQRAEGQQGRARPLELRRGR